MTSRDLLLAGSAEALQAHVLEAAGDLAGQLLSAGGQVIQSLDSARRLFGNLTVKEVVVSTKGPVVRFVPQGDPVHQMYVGDS